MNEENIIHPMASVSSKAIIGVGNIICQGAIIEDDTIIGDHNVICENVIIRHGVSIGNHNYIGAYCLIGDSAEKIGFFHKVGMVVIGNENRFTKQCTIDSGSESITTVGNNVIMLKNAHVGHDSIIKDGVTLSCNTCVGGWSEVGEGSNFGLGAVCHQRIIVPKGVMLGMNSTITKKTVLSAFKKYAGSPAREIGDNIRKEHEKYK